MKKKILSLVLALLMAASSAAFVAADEAEEATDNEAVATSAIEDEDESPYAWAVEFLYNYGIYKGTSATDLATDDDIQRYQMALFVSRISTGWVDDDKWEDGPQNSSIFTDINEGASSNYLGAISYANQKGIIEGYGNGKFGPYDGITYQNALTMVVRTLGYQGLDWPWGYIQQAVTLGLTQGITDVAYTDTLTRGEVAQIIYNAMFATTKSGSTLALDNFGIEFGWEPIVITASDLDVYEVNGATTPSDNNKTNAFVSFKLYNDDGSVDKSKDAVTYYALAADLGLDASKHEDDLAVGSTYWVLFEKDAKSNLVNIVDYRSTLVDTIWNTGKTDDEGAEQSYAIQDFLADYTLVSKYTPANYVSATKMTKPEIMAYNALGAYEVVTTKVSGLAIDWTTGDILVSCKKDDKDLAYTVKDKDGEDAYYKVAWYYNKTLDKYYSYVTETKNGTVIGIDWMTDAEFEKTYKDAIKEIKEYKPGFDTPITSIAKSAYASLALEDINLDGVAERAIYEEYGVGYFSNSTLKCGKCNKEYPSYKLENVNAAIASKAYMNGKGTVLAEVVNDFVADPCDHYDYKSAAWFAEGFTPSVDEDGAYLNGYVIYSYDKDTKEIKIVKEITNGDDADSFVATGVLRAYTTSKDNNTVTIGDTVYPIGNYNELKNNGFYKVKDNKAKYAAGLDSMFNQFVEYVVVDGTVVAINLKGETTGEYLIVKDYAGLTNDGYIAVDAYSTKTKKLSTYCIGSYNGWKQGDYYYFLTAEKVMESFAAGTIYYIKSYDETEDAYYVELAGEYGRDGYTATADELKLVPTTLKFASDGYRDVIATKDGKTTTSSAKMKSDDTYIVLNPTASAETYKAPIYVYTGKVADTNWTIEGDRITSIGGDNVFVMVNVTKIEGFDYDAYEAGMYLYEGGKVWDASYDSATEGAFSVEGRYILGASTFTVEALNLYTGKRDAIVADRNISLKTGHIYVTVSGKVVEEIAPIADGEISLKNTENFIALMQYVFYRDTDTDKYADTADYLFGGFTLDTTKNAEVTKDYMNAQLVADNHYDYNRSRVDSITTYVVKFNGETMTIVSNDLKAYIAKNKDIVAMDCAYIYDVATGKVVVYAAENANYITRVVKDKTSTVVVAEDVIPGVDIEQTYTYDEYYVNGVLDYIKVTSVKFEYVGAEKMGHNDRAEAGLGFGHLSDHVAGTYYDNANGTGLAMNGAIVSDLYMNRNDAKKVEFTTYDCDENLCDIVKAIKFIGLDIKVEANDNDAFGLRLSIGAPIIEAPATWAVWSTIVVNDVDNTVDVDAGSTAADVTSGSFLAINPDAIQDTFTADITADVH